MTNLEFDKQIEICADAERIYAELVDPSRHIGLQPLLVGIDEVTGAASSTARSYVALEEVPVAFGRSIRNRIEVGLEQTRPCEIIDFIARSAFGVRVHSRFTLSPAPDHTLVQERIRIVAPFGLRGFVTRRADFAQEALLRNLKQRIEADEQAK